MSLLLTRKIVRPLSFLAVFIAGATLVSAAPTDPDDVFFLVIELAAMLAVLWTAWRWREYGSAETSVGGAVEWARVPRNEVS